MQSPSMHLMQSCSAFMVCGVDIVAQISRIGTPADKHYVPDIHHAEMYIMQSPSMHLMQSWSAFVERGLDIASSACTTVLIRLD